MSYRLPTLILITIVLFTGGTSASAETWPPGTINVRDYGAKGDGTTDDTEAIRSAIKAAMLRINEPSPYGTYYHAGPVLVFPPGKYMISDSLNIDMVTEIRGVGMAIIEQTNPAKDVFFGTDMWRATIRDLTFSGGRHHLKLDNPNLDTGIIRVQNCRFYGSKSFAISNHLTSVGLWITDSIFIHCHQVWHNEHVDQALMRDCWISCSSEMRDKANIVLSAGIITIENLIGVPSLDGSINKTQRWIDNHAEDLTLRRCRFGGEGAGMTVVYHYRPYNDGVYDAPNYAGIPVKLTIEDSSICANSNPGKRTAVYFVELPNVFTMRSCLLATGISPAQVAEEINLANYFRVRSRDLLSFTVDTTIGTNIALPRLLTKPRVLPPN